MATAITSRSSGSERREGAAARRWASISRCPSRAAAAWPARSASSAEHYDVSMQVGERGLLPAVRAGRRRHAHHRQRLQLPRADRAGDGPPAAAPGPGDPDGPARGPISTVRTTDLPRSSLASTAACRRWATRSSKRVPSPHRCRIGGIAGRGGARQRLAGLGVPGEVAVGRYSHQLAVPARAILAGTASR